MQKTQTAKKITAILLVVTLLLGSTIGIMAAEPIRSSFEASGATVTWDYENSLIVIEIMDVTIIMEPGSNVALIGGTPLELTRPVFIENDMAFMEMDDMIAISFILMGIDPTEMPGVEGEHATAVATAQILAAQFMELAHTPNFSLAIVDTNTGFSWTQATGENADADTIFHLGSIAKTFTAVAVMQLVEQGLIDLDTPIVEYLSAFSALPSASGEGDYTNITARMLLSHTAGIYTNDMGSGFITYGGHYERFMNEFLTRFASTQMVREEGTGFEYANNGFVILGILVAHVMGHENYFQGFEQYMQENIFEPMGLARTGFVVTEELRPYVAQPYTMAGMPREFQYWNALPTGSMFSTANEIVSLMSMFLNSGYYNGVQILTPESIDKMFSDQSGVGYGFGIAQLADPSGSGYVMIGHNGGMIYNFAAMFMDFEFNVGAFSATNSTTSNALLNEALVANVLASIVLEQGGTITPPANHIDPYAVPVVMSLEEMEALTGLYLLGGVQQFFVELVDEKLYLNVPAQDLNVELVPMSDGHFATELGTPFWLIVDGEDIFFVQGANRDAIIGLRVDTALFAPDEDFMENWYGFTFKAYQEQDFYVMFIPSIRFGITEEGFAYSEAVIINMQPGTTLVVLEPIDSDIVLQYEDGEYFFYYWGLRFVRQ